MDQIELTEPGMAYAEDIWRFRQEVLTQDADNEDQFAGCGPLDTSASAAEWIRLCALRKDEKACVEMGGIVPSHMYLAIRKRDNKIVGIIDLRHHINHPILSVWGGHCGYTVRPSERGHSYAGEMLRLNMLNAKARGLTRLLITCSAQNPASEKTILANGGIFDKLVEVDGRMIKRYWITL